MEFKIWCVFFVTIFIIAITPGPSVLMVSTQGVKYGSRASYMGALGIECANLIFFVLSAMGLSSLILSAGHLFDYIKIAGAVYLVYTGSVFIYKSFEISEGDKKNLNISQGLMKSFAQGFATGISNPKAILFFVALLPQFIHAGRNVGLQLFILGSTTLSLEMLVLMAYGTFSAKGLKISRQSLRFHKWRDRIAGLIFILVGINLV